MPFPPHEKLKASTRGNYMQSGNVFGPVPSRRLGRSLGVDLVPLKPVPMIACIASVAERPVRPERKEWVSLDDTIAEIGKSYRFNRTTSH